MAPLPPALLKLDDAVKMTALSLGINQGIALDRLLDGLCDGALVAVGVFRAASGPPNALTISPANWQMLKYNGTSLPYDFVEIATTELIGWLRLGGASDGLPLAQSAVARSGAPGRPSSMHLVIEEARRRIKAGEVDAPNKKAFAGELETWISSQRDQPRLTIKTIAQNSEITSLFNGLKRARNPSPK